MSHIYTTREKNKMRKELKILEAYFEKTLTPLELGYLNDIININIELQKDDNL